MMDFSQFKRFCLGALMCVAVLCVTNAFEATSAHAQEFRDIVEKADAAVGRVITSKSRGVSTGSGFILGRDSGRLLFLTNEHVIKGGTEIRVGFLVGSGPLFYDAQVLNRSPNLDLAVLALTPVVEGQRIHRHTTLPVSTRAANKGEAVAALGFPGRADTTNDGFQDPAFFESTLTLGNISKVSQGTLGGGGRKFEIVQHTAPINPGNSGGPLIDKCTGVVGLNTAVAAMLDGDKTVPQGTFWASSGPTIARFLRGHNIPFEAASSECTPSRQPAKPAPSPQPAPSPAPEAPSKAASGNSGTEMLALLFSLIGVIGVFCAIGFYAYSKGGGESGSKSATPSNIVRPILGIKIGGKSSKLDAEVLKRGATIGRDPTCDICVPINELSRRHAKLSMVDRKLMIDDLGSSNGTSVDGKTIRANAPVQINSSSVVTLAGQRLTLRML